MRLTSLPLECPARVEDQPQATLRILLVCNEALRNEKLRHETLCNEPVCSQSRSHVRHLIGLLERAGYQLDIAVGFADAVDVLFSKVVHLVFVVFGDEDEADFQTLQNLRATAAVPVMLLSVYPSDDSGVRAFQAGADDFVTPATCPAEILLRIAALLRRGNQPPERSSVPGVHALRRAQFHLNRERRIASYRDVPLDLTSTQFRLLWILLCNARTLVRRELLYTLVLEKNSGLYDRSLDMHVCRLRKKLEAAGFNGSRLKTVRGRGYRFD